VCQNVAASDTLANVGVPICHYHVLCCMSPCPCAILATMKRKNVETLPEPQRQHATALMEKHGIEQARKLLGISRHALERAAGGLSVQRGTVAYLTQQLAARLVDGKNP
jgi:hypothetical protein